MNTILHHGRKNVVAGSRDKRQLGTTDELGLSCALFGWVPMTASLYLW
jgi:hypothetical protein